MGGIAIVALMAGLMLVPWAGAATYAEDPFPDVAASYLIKINEKAVWKHLPDRRLPPASLTKIMTALLALESGRLRETAVVSREAALETGARIGLKAGDRIGAAELLAATLLGSANDAAHALAEHIDGTEASFVRRMNIKASALGMRDTRFVNATGHHHSGHYSTANDLALMAEAALAEPRFARLAAIVRLDIQTTDGSRSFRLENRNEMLGQLRETAIIGVRRPCGKAWSVFPRKKRGRTII